MRQDDRTFILRLYLLYILYARFELCLRLLQLCKRVREVT